MAVSLPVVGVKAKALFGRSPCFNSLSKALVATKELKNPIVTNVSFPPLAAWVVSNSNHTRLVSDGNAEVPGVGFFGYFSQIAHSVVSAVAIDVVYVSRPMPFHYEPCNPMRGDRSVDKVTGHVAVPIDGSKGGSSSVPCVEHSASLLTCADAILKHIWRRVVPCHFSRFGNICDKLLGNIAGYHGGLIVADSLNYNMNSEV